MSTRIQFYNNIICVLCKSLLCSRILFFAFVPCLLVRALLLVIVIHFGIIKFLESLFESKIILVFTNLYVNFVLLRHSP